MKNKINTTALITISGFLAILYTAFFQPVSWPWIATAVFFHYFYLTVVLAFMHRYSTHLQFELKYPWIHYVFATISTAISAGSPITLYHRHNVHHLLSFIDSDPNHPKNEGLIRLLGIYSQKPTTREQLKAHAKYARKNPWIEDPYFSALRNHGDLVVFLYALSCFMLFGWNGLLFIWLIPATTSLFIGNCINYFADLPGPLNYQNFTEGNYPAYNVPWLFPLALGEVWHNNHHRYPMMENAGVKPWELDPMVYLFKLLSVKKNTSSNDGIKHDTTT